MEISPLLSLITVAISIATTIVVITGTVLGTRIYARQALDRAKEAKTVADLARAENAACITRVAVLESKLKDMAEDVHYIRKHMLVDPKAK